MKSNRLVVEQFHFAYLSILFFNHQRPISLSDIRVQEKKTIQESRKYSARPESAAAERKENGIYK